MATTKLPPSHNNNTPPGTKQGDNPGPLQHSDISWPHTYTLLKPNDDEEILALLEAPRGSLTPVQLEALRTAYQRGHALVALQQEFPDKQQEDDGHQRQRHWNAKNPVGRRRQRREQVVRGSLVLDWPYLTDLVLEGWLLLDRIVAEHQYHHQHQGQSSSLSSSPMQHAPQPHGLFGVPSSPPNDHHPEDLLQPWVLQTWRTIWMHEGRPTTLQSRLPRVEDVLPRVAACLDHRIFAWSSHLVNFQCDVIPLVQPNLRQAAHLAQAVFDTLVLGRSSSSSLSSPLELGTVEEFPDWNQWHRYPDRDTISKLVSLWSRSGDLQAPQQSLRLLQLLVDVSAIFPTVDKFLPDALVYTAVLRCWASLTTTTTTPTNTTPGKRGPNRLVSHDDESSPVSPTQAELAALAGPVALQLWSESQRNYQVELTKPLYNVILKCLTKSYNAKCQKQALDLFRQRVADWRQALETLQQQLQVASEQEYSLRNKKQLEQTVDRLEPTTSAYEPLAEGLVRSGQVHQALSLLYSMEQVARQTNQPAVAPDDRCFALIESALVRKVQAHGRDHDPRCSFLQWSLSNTPEASSSQWEEAARQTWRQLEPDLQRAMFVPQTMTKASLLKSPLSKSMEQDVSIAVRNVFSLLDKVAAESFRHGSAVDRDFLPWPNPVLERAMEAWQWMREVVRRRNKKKESTNNHAAQQANRPLIWGPECRPPLADPRWLLNRLNNYCAVGLFRPSGQSLQDMLELVVTCAGKNNTYDAAILTLALLECLYEHCGDPAQDPHFPDREPVRYVIQIWRAAAASHDNASADHHTEHRMVGGGTSTTSREEIDLVDDMVRQLRFWYLETKMDKYRPDAEMYANLVEIWCDSLGMVDPQRVVRRSYELLKSWKTLNRTAAKALSKMEESNHSHDVTSVVSVGGDDETKVLQLYKGVVRAYSMVSRVPISPADMATIIQGAQTLLDEILDHCRQGTYPLFLQHAEVLVFPLVECLGHCGQNPLILQTSIDKVHRLSLELNCEALRPTTSCYNALIRAYCAHGQVDKADEISQQMAMDDIVPGSQSDTGIGGVYSDIDSWNSILHGWVFSSQPVKAAQRAIEILGKLDASTRLEPNLPTYNLILECFVMATTTIAESSDNTVPVEELLAVARSLLERMEMDGSAPKPDLNTYLCYMNLSKVCHLPHESFHVLKRFCELCENGTISDRPDVRHFNTAIWAFAMTPLESEDAFEKACDVFEIMSDASYIFKRMSSEEAPFYAEPNEYTYRGLLQVAIAPLRRSENSSSAEDRMRRSEFVLEQIIRHKWHEKPENTQAALAIFNQVLEDWKCCQEYANGGNADNMNEIERRILILEELIRTVREQFEKRDRMEER